jgi:anti-sigma-K factor RskA
MEHDEVYELLESYVFGSFEADEADGVAAHLDSGCERCLARLRELSELSVKLAESLPQHDPPPRVKVRLLERIRGRRQNVSPARRRFGAAGLVAAASVAVVAALLVWIVGLRNDLTQLRDDLAESRQEIARLRQDMTTFDAATELLGKPCTRLVDLSGVEPNPQAFGKVVLHPDEKFGIVYVYRLPENPEGKDYQLWVMREGELESIGVFAVANDGNAVLNLGSLPDPSSITEFQVTIEPAGGLPRPSGMLYLVGENTLNAPMH